jgi:hypothetical protein
LTPEAIEAAYSKFETSMMPQLEARYQGLLTPEMTKMLEEEPAKAIPKLAARIHYHAQVAAYTGVMSQIPRILGTLLEHNKNAETAMGRFESRWPALKDEKYRAQVDQGLATWRNANPKMTTDEMIEKAGLWLMLSMGLNPTPTEPAAPPPSLPGPARPAGVGAPGSPGRIPPGGASNVFEEMAANWNQDDS